MSSPIDVLRGSAGVYCDRARAKMEILGKTSPCLAAAGADFSLLLLILMTSNRPVPVL